jgi:16S rRNA U516 pseudouridylate synthase RsuA-like enzyme
VLRLKRMEIGPLELGKLATGKSRPLTLGELKSLKRLAEKQKPVEEAAKE